MDKVDLYRQVYFTFKELCANGKQPCSFRTYCKEYGVDQSQMPMVLKDEYIPVTKLPGYVRDGGKALICSRIYEDFKKLCAQGKQPCSFKRYYESFGITRKQMKCYQRRLKLHVADLPGFVGPSGGAGTPRCQEIPFEDVIFEEAGFLPCNDENVITVRVDDHVAISFPVDTDVDVIVKFVNKARKEAGHVGA